MTRDIFKRWKLLPSAQCQETTVCLWQSEFIPLCGTGTNLFFTGVWLQSLSLESQEKDFQQSIAGYLIGNPTEIIFNHTCGPFPGMTHTQET